MISEFEFKGVVVLGGHCHVVWLILALLGQCHPQALLHLDAL